MLATSTPQKGYDLIAFMEDALKAKNVQYDVVR
jgi:hypothetical protein